MFSLLIISCLSLLLIISIYLLIDSPYRIPNWHGFVLLFLTFTIHSIFICILPFCQLYLLYFLLFIDINSFHCLFHPIMVFYCIIESFFFLFTVEEARLLNTRPLPQRILLPKNYDEQFIDRILNVYDKSKEDFRVCFAGWFKGVQNSSWNLIYEDNILEYIAMATYGVKYWNEMTHEQQKHIRHLLYHGFLGKYPDQRSKIKSGYNDQIKLRHPYGDFIQYTHYPLIKYFLFACVRSISIMLLKSMGYEYQMIDNVTFYTRKYIKKTRQVKNIIYIKSLSRNRVDVENINLIVQSLGLTFCAFFTDFSDGKSMSLPPILFLHGPSLGVNTYILFVRRLTSLDRTIILLDVPHASMRLHTEISPMSTILSSIEQLLMSLNEQHVACISHSYGTLIQSCIVKQLPHIVYDQVVLFIDPVCFLIFDSRYIDNFIYRKPRTPNQLLLYTSCTKDLYSIYAIERHLCWYECNLWVEDIKQSPIRIHVCFSENDDIIPVSFVNEYLKKSNINTTIFPHFKHGQFLMSPKVQDDVLEILHRLESKPASDDNEAVNI